MRVPVPGPAAAGAGAEEGVKSSETVVPPDYFARATDAELAAWLEEAERQIQSMHAFVECIKLTQAERLRVQWEARSR